jgi:hypothetical protein
MPPHKADTNAALDEGELVFTLSMDQNATSRRELDTKRDHEQNLELEEKTISEASL